MFDRRVFHLAIKCNVRPCFRSAIRLDSHGYVLVLSNILVNGLAEFGAYAVPQLLFRRS